MITRQIYFASSTQGIPIAKSVTAAEKIREKLKGIHSTSALKKIDAETVRDVLRAFCKYYTLPEEDTGIIFDENATKVLYQFLRDISLPQDLHIVTSIDIGQTLRKSLAGTQQAAGQSSLKAHFIHTFSHHGYQTDNAFIKDIATIAATYSPQLFLLPTVTSSGRILPFIKVCNIIDTLSKTDNVRPLIILDDAQGLCRLKPQAYKKPGIPTIWSYADAIITTGSKALGALSGTGILLFNRSHFPEISNKVYFHTNQTLEAIASLSEALQSLTWSTVRDKKLVNTQNFLYASLGKIPGIQIVTAEANKNFCVNSIVTFYLKEYPKQAEKLRTLLLQDSIPIILPKVIETESINYLRIALDPKCIGEPAYLADIRYLLRRIQIYLRQF